MAVVNPSKKFIPDDAIVLDGIEVMAVDLLYYPNWHYPTWDNIFTERSTRENVAIIDEDGDCWQRLHEPILCPYCGMKESKCGCGYC